MGWNEPKKDKDPWNGKKQPPDLDEALKKLGSILRKKLFISSSGRKTKRKNTGDSGGLLVSLLSIVALVLWALSGIFILGPADQAAILRFGKYVETVGPGPHWIPRFIYTKTVANVDRVMDYSYSAQMLTRDENLVSVSVAVQYKIDDLREYLFNVVDPEESLRQATSSALRQVVGITTLDQLITEGRDAWGASMQESLIKILELYKVGIKVVNVSPQPARAPENVQEAFDDAIKAQEDEKRFKEQARAYAAKVVPIADGNAKRIYAEANAYAEQVILRAKGDTAEFLALLPEYNKSPYVMQERMYLDTMQTILGKTTKLLVDGKSGNMLYLPLDKIMQNLPQSTTKLDSDKHFTENYKDVDSNSNKLLEGRQLTRTSERMGRAMQ